MIPVLASILILGSIGFSQNVYAPHISGLVVHYDFEDEADPTADLSGHNNDGDLSDGVTIFSTDVPPLPNNFHSLDLTTDTLDDYLISSSVTAFPSDKITTALWVKSSGTQNADPIFVSYATNTVGTAFNDWGIQNVGTTNSEFQGFVNADNSNGVLRTTEMPNVLDGEWHHVAATWDNANGEMKLYLDGVLVKSGTGIKTGETIASGGTLVLGQEQDSVGNSFHTNDDFNGFLDDVRIYNKVLSDEEIQDLFEGPIEVDIDIKPGSDPSSVNCKANKKGDINGVVPVAIFGTADFDVSTIDLSSLELNVVKVTEKHTTIHIKNLNDDGFDDAVLHLDKAGVCAATSDDGEYPLKESADATLTGSNADGDFEGTGDIRIVKR